MMRLKTRPKCIYYLISFEFQSGFYDSERELKLYERTSPLSFERDRDYPSFNIQWTYYRHRTPGQEGFVPTGLEGQILRFDLLHR